MNESILVGGIVLVAWAILLRLRVPSSVAFLSLLVGQLVSTEAGNDVYELIAGITGVTDSEYIQVGLLLLPLVVTMLLMKGRVGSSKVGIEALPYLFVALLGLVLASALFTPLNSILQIATNDQLDTYRSIIVVAACASGLVSAWLSYPKPMPIKSKSKH
jgi:hypothetical protein